MQTLCVTSFPTYIFFFSVLGSNPESYFVFILSLARFHD